MNAQCPKDDSLLFIQKRERNNRREMSVVSTVLCSVTLGLTAVPLGPPFHYCFLVITRHRGRLKSSKNQKDSIKQLLMNRRVRISRYGYGLWLEAGLFYC